MDRLTKRVDDGKAWYNHAHEKSVTNDDLLERLAVYEDAEEQGRLLVLPEKMTNADRIRAMSDEELAGFIAPTEEYGPAPWCKPIGRDRCGRPSCHSCALAYLRQPAEGGEQDV